MKTHSLDEFNSYAVEYAGSLAPRGRATLVTLSGVLGAGKTTFVQALAKALGVQDQVTSPTFVIEKMYRLDGRKFARLVHIDAYRLNGAHELEAIGWRETIADPGNLILLEWPERVPEAIPQDAITLQFDIEGEQRIITINGEENV